MFRGGDETANKSVAFLRLILRAMNVTKGILLHMPRGSRRLTQISLLVEMVYTVPPVDQLSAQFFYGETELAAPNYWRGGDVRYRTNDRRTTVVIHTKPPTGACQARSRVGFSVGWGRGASTGPRVQKRTRKVWFISESQPRFRTQLTVQVFITVL